MTTQAEIDILIARIFADVLSSIQELSGKDFIGCLVKLMEVVEEIPNIIGVDKKKVVKGVLLQLVSKLPIQNQQEKAIITNIVSSSFIDFIIDEIVTLTKNGCRINLPQLAQSCKCIIM